MSINENNSKKDAELTEKDKEEIKKAFDMYKLSDDELTMEGKRKLKEPKNKMESKFIIDLTNENMKNIKDKDSIEYRDAVNEINIATSLYDEGKFTEALTHAFKSKRMMEAIMGGKSPIDTGEQKKEEMGTDNICPKCGAKVKDGDKFCRKCGAPIAITIKCPQCGSIVESGDLFCGVCGSKLK